jgi:hypothetical protein
VSAFWKEAGAAPSGLSANPRRIDVGMCSAPSMKSNPRTPLGHDGAAYGGEGWACRPLVPCRRSGIAICRLVALSQPQKSPAMGRGSSMMGR